MPARAYYGRNPSTFQLSIIMTHWPHETAITVFDAVTSTNDTILEAGATDAPEGTTHIAHCQTRGRGRAERQWWSPPGGGLWMSTLLRPRVAPSTWSGISLVVGSAACRALQSLGVEATTLYWPNDLQVGDKKIGGILCEVRSRGARAWISVGIGINIHFDGTSKPDQESPPSDVRARATSMTECGAPTSTTQLEVAEAVLERLWPAYERFQDGKSIPELVGTDLAHVGETVDVRTGLQSWKGIVRGLGERGELLIEPTEGEPPESLSTTDGVIALTGGEVVYGNKSTGETK